MLSAYCSPLLRDHLRDQCKLVCYKISVVSQCSVKYSETCSVDTSNGTQNLIIKGTYVLSGLVYVHEVYTGIE